MAGPDGGPGVTPVQFTWQGIDFVEGVEGPFWLTSVSGWDDPPDGSPTDRPVAGWHGSLPGRMTRKARTVTIEGNCASPTDRDALFLRLADAAAAGFGDGDTLTPLVGSVAGRTLTAAAQLQRLAPKVEQAAFEAGVFGWAIQWRCPDPLRYGPARTLSAPINTATTGLTWPITFPITYPSNPIGGSLVLNNEGNARTPVIITLTGPLDTPGVICVETSRRVEFPLVLAVGDTLTIDTGAGVAYLNGEYRAPSAISALVSDLSLRPGQQTLQALGTPSTDNPGISATFQPAYW